MSDLEQLSDRVDRLEQMAYPEDRFFWMVWAIFTWNVSWIAGKLWAGFCIGAWAVTFMLQMPLLVCICLYRGKMP